MIKKCIFPYVIMGVLLAIGLISCQEQNRHEAQGEIHADSLINNAYQAHDYQQLLTLAQQLQTSKELTDMEAYYWQGYAYWSMRQMRLAEMTWKKALALELRNGESLTYYAKSANRLAGLLLLKTDYESTMRTAIPALELMEQAAYDNNSDYAYLLITVGSCQLKLNRLQEAAENYEQAFRKYLQVIESDNNLSNYTSAIAGIVTITDNYLTSKCFEQANAWISHFDELLRSYEKHPKANAVYLDKQRARLNLYRACALEGLGQHAEASRAYRTALLTDYAKTGDGKLEATNYLVSAQRWNEAAQNFRALDEQLKKYDMVFTLDIIQSYLLPKYRANVGAHQNDTALAVANQLCTALDSAIIWQKKDDMAELATIYDTQQKEAEIAQQRADLSHQRFVATIIALTLLIVFFVLFIFFRHRAACRLEAAYRELEEKNDQLLLANAKAEESSRMKTNFIQQISHEIRTPLNILSGFTQVITAPDMQLDTATKKDINRQITENTNRITRLVNKMLELSDASSQTVIKRDDTIPAVQIAAEAVDKVGIASDATLAFDFDVRPEVENIMLTTHLNQAVRALTLLLDNGRKFLTAPGKNQNSPSSSDAASRGIVRLRVELTGDTSATTTMVSFVVEDTGIGVPPEEAEHIFDEFVQLNDYYEGTGIGLTVARSIARRLGGDVQLDTAYTEGARFVFTLPA